MKIQVQVINKSENALPDYETAGAAGLDIRAYIPVQYHLMPGERILVPTGLYVAIPEGYELQIRSKSGIAHKQGVIVLNQPGTIDSDYRGEIKALLINTSKHETFTINDGDRICQMVLKKVEQLKWIQVTKLPDTVRGEGGFGSTGIRS